MNLNLLHPSSAMPAAGFVPFNKSEIEQTVAARFEAQVQRYPQRTAVQTAMGQTSYDALNRLANRIAHAIITHLGDRPGTVALWLGKDDALIAAIFGVLKAGKVCLPLDPTYPSARLIGMLSDAETALIVTDGRTAQVANDTTQDAYPVLRLDQLPPDSPEENCNLATSPDDLAVLTYTSGTTGQPKGVMHDHRSILHGVMRYTNSLAVNCADRFALLASAGHAAAFSDVLRALLNGAATVPYDINTLGMAGLANWLTEQDITIYHSVPSVYRQMLALADADARFPSVRLVHLGGGTVSLRDVELYKNRFTDNCRMVVNLSCTETMAYCQFQLDKTTQITTNSVPVGYTLEDQEVLLLDDERKEVGIEQVGEIAVKSGYLAHGYWHKPELTAHAFIADPRGSGERVYLTGDLGRMHADGCLEHLGRKDSQVKIRGYRIELTEVEAGLLALPEVMDAVAVAREDTAGERMLVAYIVPSVSPPPTVSALRKALAPRLPNYMVPSAFVMLDTLPLTPHGKVDKRALPAPGRSRPALDTPLQQPRQTTEVELARIWSEVLQLDQVGVDDDFFELGGSSLLAMRLAARVEETLKCRLPVTELFANPTIAQLAAVIESGHVENRISTLVPIQPVDSTRSGAQKPAFFCMHGFTGGVMDYADLARRLGPDQPFYGVQAWAWVNEAEADTTVEAMAQRYANDIRALQSQGPYYLGGHCYGARLTYAVACQLEQQGQQVALLALIEASVPRTVRLPRVSLLHPSRLVDLLRDTPFWLAEYGRQGYGKALKRVWQRMQAVGQHLVSRVRGTAQGSQLDRVEYDSSQFPDDVRRISELNRQAMAHYHPAPYKGRITLFKAQHQTISQSLFGMGRIDLGWDALTSGGVDIVICPGTHENLHLEPQVAALAEQLGKCLISS